VLVVGHNTALRLALCAWLGIPVSRYRDVLPRLDNASITQLRVPPEPSQRPTLLSLNVPAVAVPPAAVPTAPVPIDWSRW
ncbi:MAG TPA: histidine phosphatase family protein, partial [Pseudonocardia sp.]|nr:histidine phosphatase family protein [Pseudonocardia sp.]